MHKKEIFDLQERHNSNDLDLPNKNFFFNNYTVYIFLFGTAIISLVVTTIVMYILCKYMKIKSLVTSLALQQIKEVGVVAKQEHVSIAQDIKCTSKIQWYTNTHAKFINHGLSNFCYSKIKEIKTV